MNQLTQINTELAKANASTEAAQETLEEEKTETVNELDSLVAEVDSAAKAAEDQAAALEEYKKTNPLFYALNFSGQVQGPVVGTVHYTDTAKVMDMLTSQVAKSILPRELKLVWTVKAIDKAESLYQLVALKSINGRPSLEGEVITDARADFSQTSAYANVSMTMNNEGARKWQRITRDNIGKSIAIVLDGYAYRVKVLEC